MNDCIQPLVRPVVAGDLPVMLALNNAYARELSQLDAASLQQMVARSFRSLCVGAADAFLVAFDETSDYGSQNFAWFKSQYDRFVYIDRVAVGAMSRGQGIARLLYEDLFLEAAGAGHVVVGCEVNIHPPNPISDLFHTAMGFTEVGQGDFPEQNKRVRYLVHRL